MAVKALLAKDPDSDLIKGMKVKFASLGRDDEVEGLTGADRGERSAGRTNHRNGYRVRDWCTGVGIVPVAITKLAKGSNFPSFLAPRRSADKAPVAVFLGAHVHGVSKRSPCASARCLGRLRSTGARSRCDPGSRFGAEWLRERQSRQGHGTIALGQGRNEPSRAVGNLRANEPDADHPPEAARPGDLGDVPNRLARESERDRMADRIPRRTFDE
ncbi:MAG: hypothetical protein GC150_17430 [Rhizobiales bacterium]|nr:hypothetical protein [Hyphomicrobiales bacterium]